MRLFVLAELIRDPGNGSFIVYEDEYVTKSGIRRHFYRAPVVFRKASIYGDHIDISLRGLTDSRKLHPTGNIGVFNADSSKQIKMWGVGSFVILQGQYRFIFNSDN